jgi:hypothetical protein
LEPWTYVGQVAGMPTEIFYEVYGPIYVRTSNKETFACDMKTQTCVIDTEARDFDRFYQAVQKWKELTPFAPGTVVVSSVWWQPWGDYGLLQHIIAIDDGRIWTWAKMPDYSPFIGGLIYGALSFVVGIVFLIFLWLRRPQQKAKNDAKHV